MKFQVFFSLKVGGLDTNALWQKEQGQQTQIWFAFFLWFVFYIDLLLQQWEQKNPHTVRYFQI